MISATPLIFYEFSKFPWKMHYGYRKKRLYNFPLLHHAPFVICFDCFMWTFIVPIWDKKFQIFRRSHQTPFSWSNARSLKETFTKNHASTTRDRLNGFAQNFHHGFATKPEGTRIIISPGGSIERPIAGGQFLPFPGVPPWEAGKFFTSDLGESRHTVQGDDSE